MKFSKILFLILLLPLFGISQVKVKELPTKTTNFKQGDNIIIDDSAGTSGATKKITIRSLKTNYGFGTGGGSSVNPTSGFIPFNNSGTFANSWLKQNFGYILLTGGKILANEDSTTYLDLSTTGGFDLSGPNSKIYNDIGGLHIEKITGEGIRMGGEFRITYYNDFVIDATNVVISQGTASKLLYLDASKNIQPVTIGSGLTLITNTLSATGGGATDTTSLSNRINTKLAKVDTAIFNASDFNQSGHNITIDYTNGQKATGSIPGLITAADWTAFNSKLSSITGITAGGDLSGTYANPTVSKILGNTVPSNASGVLTNNGSGTLTWAVAGGGGTVTTFTVTPANGFTGTVANPTTTPALTIIAGAITPTSVNSIVLSGSSTPTLAVTGTSTISGTHSGTSSGTNTGDQTSVTGNAGTATALQTSRTIGGVSFDGTASITVASATGGFTVTGGNLSLTGNMVIVGQSYSAFVTITDAATINTDCNTGMNFKVTLGGNRTLANPTNMQDGATYTWKIKQDATGSRTLTFGSKFDFGISGNPTLSTSTGKWDYIVGIYDSVEDKISCTWNGGF